MVALLVHAFGGVPEPKRPNFRLDLFLARSLKLTFNGLIAICLTHCNLESPTFKATNLHVGLSARPTVVRTCPCDAKVKFCSHPPHPPPPPPKKKSIHHHDPRMLVRPRFPSRTRWLVLFQKLVISRLARPFPPELSMAPCRFNVQNPEPVAPVVPKPSPHHLPRSTCRSPAPQSR